jgi:glucose-1-phosphate cytidylyltransferase
MATYGDGLTDVDLNALLAFHRKQGTLGTVTVVNPTSQFGEVVIGKDQKVREFREKPKMEKWVNGGFFVFEREFFSYLGERDILEREPLERLAVDGQLSAFRHEGFWQCMDTFKDASVLNDLWSKGDAPWKIWKV